MVILDEIDLADDFIERGPQETFPARFDLNAPGIVRRVLSAFVVPSGLLTAESREEINR